MRYKLTQTYPLLTTLVGAALAPASNWCIDVLRTCYGTWVHQIALSFTQPLSNFALPTILIAVAVILVPHNVFKSWLKFSAWFLPLCLIFVATTPVSWTGLGPDFFPYYRINAAHDAGIAFTVLSLLLVAYKLLRERMGKRKTEASSSR